MANQDFRVKNGLQVGLGASIVGIVTAESFTGSAVGLTAVPSESLTGTISSERLSGTYNIDITGTVSGDSINVGSGNTGVFANSDGTLLVTGITTFKDRVIFDSTNSIQVPVGTDGEKDAVGTAVTGQIRYNTTNSQFEGFGPGNDWGSLGGVKDVDGDTYVKAESSPGSDEDALTFFTGSTERAVIDSNGNVGIATTNPTATLDLDGTLNVSGISTFQNNVEIDSTGYLKIPVGLSTDRPTGTGVTLGQIRYNSELSQFEGYGAGDAWGSLGGIKDVDQDTYITAESSAGADEDALTFFTGGTEKAVIDSTGKVGIGSTQPTSTLDVDGTLNVSGVSTFLDNVNIGTAATTVDLPGLYLKGNSATTNFLQNPSISIGGTTASKYYDTFLVDDPNVQYVRHWSNGFDINFSVSDDRLFVVSNIDGASSVSPAGVVDGHIAFKINPETSTELRYNKNTKLETTTDGFKVLNGTSETAVISGPQNIILDPSPDDVVAIVEGDISAAGVSTITGITTTNIAIGNLIQEVDGVISAGTTVTSVGISSLTISNVSLGSTTNQEFTFANQTPTGIVRIKGDLYIDGTRTEINSTTLTIDDLNVVVASGATDGLTADTAGLTVDGANAYLKYNYNAGTNETWELNKNVGIGTDNATAKLDVDGTLNVSGISTFASSVFVGAGSSVSIGGTTLGPVDSGIGQMGSIQLNGDGAYQGYAGYNINGKAAFFHNDFSGSGTDYHGLYDTVNQKFSLLYLSDGNPSNPLSNSSLIYGGGDNAPVYVRPNYVQLNHIDGTTVNTRLETTGYGVTVSGGLNVSGVSTFQDDINVGAGKSISWDVVDDFHITTTSGHGLVETNGELYFGTTHLYIQKPGGTTTMAEFIQDGAVKLNHNNITKLQTHDYGIDVTGHTETDTLNVSGIATAQLFSGNGGSLTNVSAFEAYKSDISERAYKTDEISGSLVYAYDGQRFSNLGTGGIDDFAVKSVISKDGKVAFVSEYDTTNKSLGSGRIHIYERTGANFTAIGIVTQTSHSSPGAAQTTTCFGPIIACNADGSIFAVGSPQGNYNGLAGSHLGWWHNPTGPGQQSVHIFQKNGSTITNIGILTSPSIGSQSNGIESFGGALAFSDDGSRLYVGSPERDNNNFGENFGAVFAYDKSGTTYNYVGIITTTSSAFGDSGIGQELACSSDGNILFVGWPAAYRPDSGGSGGTYSGVIEIYDRSGSNFTNIGIVSSGYYLSGANAGDVLGRDFGNEIACSDDGTYLYSISRQPGNGAEQYSHGKLHLFKRESNIYSEVSSDTLDSPVYNGNELGWGLACSSDGSKVIAGECNITGAGAGNTGFVHYYGRVGDGIVRVGFATAGIAQGGSFQVATFGLSADLSGSGEVGIVGSPYQTYVNTGGNGAVFFLKETRGTTVYSDILTGNIGIKTDAPKATLDVNGTLNVSGIATAQKFVGDGSQLRSLSTNELVTYASHADSSYSSSQVSAISGYRQVGAAVTHGYTHMSSFAESETKCSADGKIFAVSAHSDTETTGGGYGVVHVYERHANSSTRIGILTGSYASDNGDNFGTGIALSADGKTIVVGADSDETPETGSSDGVAYVFDFIDGEYTQVGILTSPEPSAYRGKFGNSISMSSNGKIIYVGAYADTYYDGAVHCFDRDGDQFNYVGFVTTAQYSNYDINFGWNIDCTADGKRLVVGAPKQTHDSFPYSYANKGIVYVYDRIGDNFENVGILTSYYDYTYNTAISNNGGLFGWEVRISADGNTIAATARQDGGDNTYHSAQSGSVYIFDHKHRDTYLDPTNDAGTSEWVNTAVLWSQGANDIHELYGTGLALSADGNLVAIGAPGMPGDHYTTSDSGVVYVYKRDTPNTIGIQTGYGYQFTQCAKFTQADPSSFYTYGGFGQTLDMSADGKSIIVGRHSSSGSGNADAAAAYIFDQITKTYLSTSSRTGSVHFKEEHLSRIGDNGLNEDFGLNWNKVELDTYTGSNADNYTTIRALEYCGNGIVLAGVGSTAVGTADSGTIYRSTDYGKTWQNMNTNLITEGNSAYVKTIEYCGNGIVLAGVTTAIEGTTSGFQLLRSTDYGQNWNNLVIAGDASDQCDAVNDLVYIGDGKIIAGVNTGGNFYESDDYGLTWGYGTLDGGGSDFKTTLTVEYCGRGHEDSSSFVGDGEGIVLIAGGDRNGTDSTYEAGNAFVVAYVNPHRTSGSKSSWQPRTSIDPNVTRINILKYCENDIVLAGTASTTNNDYALFRSTDYGKSWNNITSYLPSWSSTEIRTIEYCGNGIIFAGSLSSPNATLYKSTDFGFTWELVSVSVTGSSIESIKYCGGDIIFSMDNGTLAGDQGCIFRSDSGFAEGQSLQGVYHQNKTGNIGIGSTQPKVKLDVNGDINVGAAVSLRAAYSGGTYPSDRLYITSTDPSRPGSIAIGKQADWAGQNLSDVDIVMEANNTGFNFANIEITQVSSNLPFLEISSIQETTGLLREYSEIIQKKGDLTLLAEESDSSIIFGTGNSGAQVIDTNDKPLVKLNVNPSNSADANIVLGGEMTLTPVGGGVTIGGNVDISGITTIGSPVAATGITTNFKVQDGNAYLAVEFSGSGNTRAPYIASNGGSGGVYLSGDSDFAFTNYAGNELYLQFERSSGRVNLRHGTGANYSTRLSTTEYGIDVTGRVETDTLNVSGISTAQLFSGDGGSLTNLSAYDSYKSNISERAFKSDEISGVLSYALDGQRISGTSGDPDDRYGLKTTLSKDGKIAFVSQYVDDTQSHAGGTIHIYERTGANFTSIGIVTQTSHSSPGAGQTVEGFGPIVACNADATIFAVGSPQGIDAHGDNMSWWHVPNGSSDPHAQQSVQIFQRNGSTITNIGILTSPSPGTSSNGNDSFGASLAFSDDGSKLYVGSPFRKMATGKEGAVFAYDKSGLTYNHVGIMTVISSTLDGIYGGMGNSVECSSDGNTIFVGHPGARRLHLGSTDTINDTKQAGTVEIYDRSGSTFTLVGDPIHGGYFTTGTKVDQPIGRGFGHVIACSDDGNYFYATSYDDSGQSEEYPYGKLHLFKRESNTYSEVDSSKLESPYSTNNRLGYSLACDSSGSRVIAGECDIQPGSSAVHYYVRVGDNITRVGFTTSVVATQGGIGSALWGWDLDLNGSGEVGIIGAPYVKYVGDAASVTGNIAFLEQSRGTSVYSDILTGNIGIGSTQPTSTLDVDGTLNVSGISTFSNRIDANGNLDVDGHTELDDLNVSGISTFQDDVNIGTGATVAVFDVSSGNVGIGSTIPAYTLDLGESPSTIRLVSDDGGTAIRMGAGDQNHDFTMLRVDGATGQHDGESGSQAYGFSLRYIGSLTGNNNKLRIVADNQTGTPINAFTMLQDGSVGINSINPTATLDVNGSVSIKNHSIVSIETSLTSVAGVTTTIDTFATSSNDLAEYTIHVGYGNTIQAQKVLVMHDGTTAYSQEYAVMYNPNKIVSIGASISGSNVLLQATPETGVSGITTYKIVRGGLV